MTNLIILILFLVLSAFAKSSSDVLTFRFSSSIFSRLNHQFWNPQISWRNKYSSTRLLTWLLSTVLVPFTDGFHLTQSVHIFATFLAGLFAYKTATFLEVDFFLVLIASYFLRGLIHETSFNNLLLLRGSSSRAEQNNERLLAGEEDFFQSGSVRSIFWRSLAVMSTLFFAIVSQVWIFRTIHGGYQGHIFTYKGLEQWPEYIIVAEILIFIGLIAIYLINPDAFKRKRKDEV